MRLLLQAILAILLCQTAVLAEPGEPNGSDAARADDVERTSTDSATPGEPADETAPDLDEEVYVEDPDIEVIKVRGGESSGAADFEVGDSVAAFDASDLAALGAFKGRNILHQPQTLDEVAQQQGLSLEELREVLEESRPILYEARNARPKPLRDDKILTSWNGLMISAFAQAGMLLGEAGLLEVARRAADFVLADLRVDGRLRRSYKDGRSSYNAYLDDYAFMIAALIDLFEASADARYLREAIALDEVLREHYEDNEGGGFFMTSDDHEQLLVREKPSQDGAEPCGNSVQALNLFRLASLTGRDEYRQRGDRLIAAFSAILAKWPSALSEMLLAMEFRNGRSRELIMVIAPSDDLVAARPFLDQLAQRFVPNRVVVTVREGEEQEALAELVPMVANKLARDGKPTAYLCERGVCNQPTNDVAEFSSLLARG